MKYDSQGYWSGQTQIFDATSGWKDSGLTYYYGQSQSDQQWEQVYEVKPDVFFPKTILIIGWSSRPKGPAVP